MMQLLRKYMKQIFVIVLAAFLITIVFSWGMGGFGDSGNQARRGIIGTINGTEIYYQQYARMVEQELSAAREESGQESLPEYQVNTIRERTWENLIQEILIRQEVERLGIEPSNHEIFYFMKNNPPDFIRQSEALQTDGKFDMNKYQEVLANPQYFDAFRQVENYFRESLPPYKLQQLLISTVRVTDAEVKAAYRAKTEKATVQYLFWDKTRVSSENIEITDKEIKTYYDEHVDEFEMPEKRSINYVALELKPSHEDTFMLKQDILDYKAMLEDGADFAELARDYSDDPGSAENGGDLGFFGQGAMVKPFEDATFGAKIGDIVGPVKTNYGFHLIKVLDKRREQGERQVKAQHILRKFQVSPETRDNLYNDLEYLYDELEKRDPSEFMDFAKVEGFEVKTSAPFEEGSYVPGIGMSARINNATFGEKQGFISQPVVTDKQIVLFQVAEIEKAYTKPLDEVKEEIKTKLLDEKLLAKAGEACRETYEQLENTGGLEAIAAENGMTLQKPEPFTIKDYVPHIGKEPAFSATAFKLNIGEISAPVKTEKGYYIIQVLDRTKMDEAGFEAVKETEKKSLLNEKQQTYMNEWYKHLKESADIEDFRKQYY